MNRIVPQLRALAFAAALASAAFPAFAINLGAAAPSFDGAWYVSEYPNGDKPQSVCTSPSGWTEADKTTGAGEICDQGSNEWDLSVLGGSAQNGFHYAYKSGGTGDFQITARFTDTYSGVTANFAGVGLTASDGTGDSDYFLNCFSPFNTSYAIRMLAGTPGGTITTANGSNGTSRARYGAITYDDSQTDGRCWSSPDGTPGSWLQVGQISHDFGASPIVGVSGQSGSTTKTLTATVDSITFATGSSAISSGIYTPTGGPSGGPTLVTPIANQSAAQGVLYSLSCAANFSGATSYTISGLPGGTGLTFNGSTCALSGLPAANDVGVRNLTVTAHNGSGDTDATFQLTVTGSLTGTVFAIADVADGTETTFNCAINAGLPGGANWSTIRTSGSAARPGAGDTIVLPGGAGSAGLRAATVLNNCSGSFASKLRIVNDVTANGPAVIRFDGQATASSTLLIQGTSTNWILDGSGGYVGASADPNNPAHYGILLTKTGSAQPDYYLRLREFACTGSDSAPGSCVIKGIAADAQANSGGLGICYSLNDHREAYQYLENPTLWRENVTFEGNYGAFCGAEGEGMYIGPNQRPPTGNPATDDRDLPLRGIHFVDNVFFDSGRECINTKAVFEGNNTMTGNRCYRPGRPQDAQGSQNDAFNIDGAASWRVADNLAVGPGGNCFRFTFRDDGDFDTATPTAIIDYENNFCIDPGKSGNGSFYGFELAGAASGAAVAASSLSARIRSNTVVDAKSGFISAKDRFNTSTCASANNISVENGTNTPAGCGNTNNRTTGTIAQQQFVNGTTANGSAGSPSTGDFHLTVNSPACGAATNNTPDDDYDGDARPGPNGSRDQGADEASACP